MISPKVDEIIKQIPVWKDADKIQVEPLAGLNNTNYLVTVNGDRFVLRVGGKNTVQLGTQNEGLMREVEEFNYLDFANVTFEALKKIV